MAATPVVVVLVVTLVSGPGGRPAVAVDSPLDLQQFEGAALVAYQVAFAVSITVFLMSAASLLMRFRRARGVERQQLRWVAFATVVVSLLSLANLAALALGAYALAPVVGGLNPPILSAAIGAAILRYRLYDLDRIISRTLAYGLLTLLLGLAYAGVCSGSAGCYLEAPAWSLRPPPWPWQRCPSPPAAGSSGWWIGASTGVVTMPA